MPAARAPAPSPRPRPRPTLAPAPAVAQAPAPARSARPLPVAGPDGITAPGIAAMLRRHPAITRRAGVGTIAAGTALFVIASLTNPAATANPDHLAAAGAPAVSHLGEFGVYAGTSAGGGAKHVTKRPRAAAATPRAIRGLAANGIPNVALNAYRVAAARMSNADPGCGIDWAMLAGIGRVESDHGRYGGAVLHSDGTSTPQIIGPALDGTSSELIYAPPNGMALAGDAVYTHALGPMQFIPQTWAGYGADANGDGTADVFNVNDAALGAARYLCAAGGNLRTQDGRTRAVLAYNNSTEYLAQVLALADAYRRGVSIAGLPVGQLTGALPPVRRVDVPAANPGPPTAVGGGQNAHHRPAASGGSGGSAGRPPGGESPSSRPPGSSSRPPSGGSSSSPTSSGPPPPPSSSSSPPPPPSSTPPSPSPTKTCHVPIGDSCLFP